jgi:protoporphyrinogen oxidase
LQNPEPIGEIPKHVDAAKILHRPSQDVRTEKVHAVILGAGPAGLAAGYVLAKAGKNPVILERDKVPGGLMRSIKRGEFIVDVGRKELYNRLEKVDRFWSELLGDQYRSYPHRGGVLYDGLIFDQSPAYRGFRRGMPWGTFLGCVWDFGLAQVNRHRAKPRTVEEYFYQTRGRRVTQIVSQGFQEKLTGTRWSEIPMPKEMRNGREAGLVETLKGAFVRTFSSKEVNTFKDRWRHPAKGTGQICDTLAKGICDMGGRIEYSASIAGMTTSEGHVDSITAQIDGETIIYQAENVVSSIPIEFLVQFLLNKSVDAALGKDNKPSPFRKKTVVLVYLFFDETPRFPHAWLIVTCPKTRIGRITNYAGFNGEMVPKGKTALCLEYYCFDDDSLLSQTNEQLAEMALSECAKYNLADPSNALDNLVLRFHGADASQNRHNWLSKIRLGLLDELKRFRNLYYVSRTDLDIATLAGIEAAEAILTGERILFDRHIDPTQIGIRSERKPFEFKNPVGQF